MRHQILSRGFSILEWLSTLVVLGVLVYIGLSSHRYYQMIDHRSEATQALQEMAKTQQYYYRQNGRYGSIQDVWQGAPFTKDKHYALNIVPQRDGYLAIAQAVGHQLSDQNCLQIILSYHKGKVERYPALCWGQSSKK